ncbi:dipeptide epimerase [Agriterribacter sp.]|uniref:dipeptide epimerase n=1 Tax=Agriterribacter sp. TaxID=2821509 RepID=UPI002C763138|nr:dipeptide epimerase [Agriterribacter sp.]HTN05939.1 dipeptide epimerase [Agriterribacter sp.]
MAIKIQYRHNNLKFRHPFTISKGTKTHQPSLLVELNFNGIKGYGEAPAITYYDITVEKMIADIERKKPFIEKFSFTHPDRYWHYLHHLFPANPFLVAALDIAAWDIYGKLKKQPLYQLWNTAISAAPVTDYTIGIDFIEKMLEKMEEKPWPVYKIKLGTKEDIAIMEALRKHSDAVFRVDANAGWTVEEALDILPVLQQLNVELVEQPLAKHNWEGMKLLYEQSPLPLFADESCVGEADVKKCQGYFHGINIKLTKCSGITPALRMIAEAKQLGMKIMLGSMNESTAGTAAIVHLSPQADYIDADGPLLLEEDIALGLHYDFGKITPTENPGLGIDVGNGGSEK